MTKDIEQYLQTKFGNSIGESNERQLYQALMAETKVARSRPTICQWNSWWEER